MIFIVTLKKKRALGAFPKEERKSSKVNADRIFNYLFKLYYAVTPWYFDSLTTSILKENSFLTLCVLQKTSPLVYIL